MNIKELLRSAEDILTQHDIECARLETELLLAHILKVGRLYLYINPEQALSQEQIDNYNMLIERRANHEPTAYILGHREFMDLDLIVNEDVLIPRPETEVLVETVIDNLNDSTSILKIADIGTGSGAIAISLAKSLPSASVEAVDISEKALTVARLNTGRYNLLGRITFNLGDLFKPLYGKKYNAIVSNPPYIPSKVIDTLQAEVRDYEPSTALDGGADGLEFYRRLIEESPKLLADGGFLAVEIGFDQAEAVRHLAKKYFKDIEVVKDLSHNDRVIVAKI
ncbi:MAG: peptide chain release factor N(5)-glutamine methyltransferase [Selenomonadaceae bacterium]|nr:peptide chain release factor N(5)-glutamine methyltransferase [Selenomonadaceae bacterium]